MNYPSGIVKKFVKNTTYNNRGMQLEDAINNSNAYYLVNNIAVIYKKPTPIKVLKIAYVGNKQKICDGYFEKPSTTDYNGIYKGKYIDFETKETNNDLGFPLANIHQHQLDHIKRVYEHGGITFIVVRFTSLNLTYYLDGSKLLKFLTENTKKNISIKYFEEYGVILKDGLNPRINYLKIIDNIYFKGE